MSHEYNSYSLSLSRGQRFTSLLILLSLFHSALSLFILFVLIYKNVPITRKQAVDVFLLELRECQNAHKLLNSFNESKLGSCFSLTMMITYNMEHTCIQFFPSPISFFSHSLKFEVS